MLTFLFCKKKSTRNQSHVEFVRNNCLDPTGFEPVKFFSYFQFKISAREFATNVLKEVVESLKNDSDEQIVTWAEGYSKYDYQVTANRFFLCLPVILMSETMQ